MVFLPVCACFVAILAWKQHTEGFLSLFRLNNVLGVRRGYSLDRNLFNPSPLRNRVPMNITASPNENPLTTGCCKRNSSSVRYFSLIKKTLVAAIHKMLYQYIYMYCVCYGFLDALQYRESGMEPDANPKWLVIESLCVCVSKWKESARPMASTTSKNRKPNEKKSTEQEEAHFVSRVTVTLTREKERLSTKSTHVTVYLFWDLNRDRSRLPRVTVGPKGRYSAKRRTCKRHPSKTLKHWNNLHRRWPLAGLRTWVLSYTWHRERRVELLVMYNQTFGTHTLGTRTAERKRKERTKWKLSERRKNKWIK